MSFKNLYDFDQIRNEIEELVIQELEKQLNKIDDEDICKCEECVLDMACFCLNKLKPRYSTSLLGTLYARAFDEETIEEAEDLVSEAIWKVAQNPPHDLFP